MRTVPRVLIFLGVISLFLYIANLVVYESIATMFDITSSTTLLTLGSVLGIGSGSFILSTVLGMRYYNVLSRISYTLSAIWMGFFVYLFFASTLFGFFVLIPGLPFETVGAELLSITLILGVYGLIHARRIYTTEVTVSLPDLPETWHGRRAVWISDLHLGQLHGAPFAARVTRTVNNVSPDIVFIGGDLFDGTGAPDITELTEPMSQLSAPLGSYFITGNHEEFGDRTRFTDALLTHGIKVLIDELVDVEGLQLIGVDYHNASNAERFKNILADLNIDTTRPSILLKHEPKDLDVAEAAGVSLQISGHTHRGQQWPLGYVAQLVYKGYAYGLKKFGDLHVYTSSGTGTWGPPIRVGTRCEVVVFTFKAELTAR